MDTSQGDGGGPDSEYLIEKSDKTKQPARKKKKQDGRSTLAANVDGDGVGAKTMEADEIHPLLV